LNPLPNSADNHKVVTACILTFGAVFTAWALLSVVGSERHNAITRYQWKLAAQEKRIKDAAAANNKPHL
jgi:hypothetical protein